MPLTQAIKDYVMKTSVAAAEHYPSMHQDLIQNHRPTEIDYINGAVAKKGDALGMLTISDDIGCYSQEDCLTLTV